MLLSDHHRTAIVLTLYTMRFAHITTYTCIYIYDDSTTTALSNALNNFDQICASIIGRYMFACVYVCTCSNQICTTQLLTANNIRLAK